jgi:DNA repair protein RadC
MSSSSRVAESCAPFLSSPSAEARSHRPELEARLLACGPTTLDDVDCLELLCAVDEAAAAELLAAFGSLPEVMGASAADLTRVGGHTPPRG